MRSDIYLGWGCTHQNATSDLPNLYQLPNPLKYRQGRNTPQKGYHSSCSKTLQNRVPEHQAFHIQEQHQRDFFLFQSICKMYTATFRNLALSATGRAKCRVPKAASVSGIRTLVTGGKKEWLCIMPDKPNVLEIRKKVKG